MELLPTRTGGLQRWGKTHAHHMNRASRWSSGVLVMVAGLTICGCVHTQTPAVPFPTTQEAKTLEGPKVARETPSGEAFDSTATNDLTARPEAMMVTVAVDPCVGDGAFDGSTLGETALRAVDVKDNTLAARCYGLFLRSFPDDRRSRMARFNRGLSLARLGDHVRAIDEFHAILAATGYFARRIDAQLELGASLRAVGNFQTAIEIYMVLLDGEADQTDELDAFEKVEALTGQGLAYAGAREFSLSENTLWDAFHAYRRAQRDGEHVESIQLTQILLGRAELSSLRFAAAKLLVPADGSKEEMDRSFASLEEKATHLVAAQRGYLRAIRRGDPRIATLAGYKIGALYEQFYQDMVAAPQPASLDPLEREVYAQELGKKVRVLLKKAMLVFGKVERLAARIGVENEWVKRSRLAVKRLTDNVAAAAAADQEREDIERAAVKTL